MANNQEKEILHGAVNEEYKYGFVTDIDTNVIPKGLNEDVVRQISALKKRAGMAVGVPPEGVSPLGHAQAAHMGASASARD